MNTQKAATLTLILTVLIIIAIFSWAAFTSTETSRENTGTPALKSGTGTIASLLTSNMDMECAFTFDTLPLGKGEGIAYINADGKVRADAVAVQNSASTGLHVLNDGKFVYTWSGKEGEKPFGTILRLNAETRMDTMEGKPILAIDTVYTDVTYTCTPWIAEKTVYIPPGQVSFTDYALALQQIIEGIPQSE